MRMTFGFLSSCRLSTLLATGFAMALAIIPTTLSATMPPDVQALTVESDPLAIEFQITAKQGVVNTWSFGDGTSTTGDNVQHTYARQGSFFVTLSSDDGGLVTENSFWVTAGNGLELLDFEAGLPVADWVTTGMTASPEGRIRGSKGVVIMVVHPNPTPSCTMPIDTPPDENPLQDIRRRWLLSALVDLTNTPLLAGASFEAIRVFDDTLTDPIFGVRFFEQAGQWHSVGFAADGAPTTLIETTPQVAGTGPLLVELQIELGDTTAGTQGSMDLRVTDYGDGQEVFFEQNTTLDNGHLALDAFDFGFVEATFPSISQDGDIKLDHFQVITDSCLPPSADQLLGYWDFEDSLQIGHDSSGQGRHGLAMGNAGVTTGRTRPGGISEQALDLDGASHVEIPSLGFDFSGLGAVTVEAWVKVAAHSQMNLFRAQQPLAVRANGISVSNYVDGNGWESAYASPDPPVDQWYHLATVFDQGEARVYVNGDLAREKTLTFQTLQGTNYADWAIGARVPGANGADQFFTGQIDDLRVYSRALDSTEIRAAAGLCD